MTCFRLLAVSPVSSISLITTLRQADIQEYGLLTYKDFERFFPKEIYDLLPCKYLNVSVGKGLITWDIFEGYVKKWKDQLMENMK